MEILFYYLFISLILWICLSIYLVVNTHKISFLKDQPISIQEQSLAIVIAVRNEEDHLHEALSSVCNLNYPSLRIIVVDDRSTDKTTSILEELSLIYPQIISERIDELASSWLGKTHALYRGSLKVSEDWILFTDADVLFNPDALKKAMSYVLQNNLDHLTILPQIRSRSELLNGVLTTFQIMLEVKLRPWLVSNSKSSASIGVGAFNLVRRTAYGQIGGHERIKLRPDDDLQLGKAFKQAGFRQDVLYGQAQVELEWYSSIREFINGLMKNTFAGLDYQLYKAVGAALGSLLFFGLPIPLGLFSGNLTLQLIALSIIVLHMSLFIARKGFNTKWWYSLTISFAGVLMAYIILKATFLTLKNKGIYWRDSFYALEELKKFM
jgi:glycosyltransferase involved in cell wall biosynthesis